MHARRIKSAKDSLFVLCGRAEQPKLTGYLDRRGMLGIVHRLGIHHGNEGGTGDPLFEQGLPRGSCTVICGPPGSGKTILSLQFLVHGAERCGDPGIFVAFEDGRNRPSDIYVWSLARGARTWRGPARVNDTPDGDRSFQYLPKISVAPDGRLDVVYYDRRDDPAGRRNHVSAQSSTDGGQTFTPHVTVTDQSFDSRIGAGRSSPSSEGFVTAARRSRPARAHRPWRCRPPRSRA